MDYYAKIKPTLNKLSKLEIFDSLDVVRRYVKCTLEEKGNSGTGKQRDRYLFHRKYELN